MPAQNVTIDDASALIQYIAPDGRQWVDSPTKDQELPKYRDHTYHSSNLYGAWAAIRFEGTAIYLYAAKRSRHGTYNIILDGQLVFQGNGYAALPSYDEVMFSTTGLSPGWHNLTCVNSDPTNQTYTEVDYITWTTTMQDTLTETTGTTILYTPGAMAYSSLNAWKEDLTDSTPYMTTSSDGASVDITFDGNGVSLYGVTGPSYGTFSAKIDGYDSHELSAYSGQAHNALLFRQDNLPSGKHTLTVTNRGTSLLSVASAVPLLWTDPNQQSSHIGSGVIAGAAVAAVTGLALIAFLLLWILRRRRRAVGQELRVHSIQEPAFIDATPFVLPASPGAQSSQIQSPATARHSKHGGDFSPQYATYPLHYHTVPGSPGMSSRGSFEAPQSSAGLGAPSSSAGGGSSGWAPAPAGAWGAARPSSKGRLNSASTSRTEIPENVEVLRESDAGPILLPPAYSASFASQAQAGYPTIVSPTSTTDSSLLPVGSVTPSPRPSTSAVPSPLIPVSALSVSNAIPVERPSHDYLAYQGRVTGNEQSQPIA